MRRALVSLVSGRTIQLDLPDPAAADVVEDYRRYLEGEEPREGEDRNTGHAVLVEEVDGCVVSFSWAMVTDVALVPVSGDPRA